MLLQFFLRQRPEGIGLRRRQGNQVFQPVVFLLVEVPEIHQLFGVGIAAQLFPVRYHFGGKIPADAGKGVEGGRIGPVEVDLGNVDEGFQPPEHRIGHHEGFGKILLAAETAAFLAVMVDGFRLFLRESQAFEVLDGSGVGVEPEGLVAAGLRLFANPLHRPAMTRIPPLFVSDDPVMMAFRAAFRGCGVGRIHPSLNDIHRIRRLFGGEDMQLGGAVDEEGGLVTDGQEGEGNGAHDEGSGQLPPFFVVFHSLVVCFLFFCGFGMFFSDRCTCHDQDNLSFGFMFFIPGGYLGQRTAPVFFVDFGNLPGHAAFAVGTEKLGQLLQRFHQPIRRFVENQGPGLCRQRLQQSLAAFFHGQETLKAESVAGESGRYDGGDAGRRPRKRLHLNAFAGAGARQQEARIGNAGRSGIADQRDICPRENLFLDQFYRLVLVEFVMRHQLARNPVMMQQDRTRPGIFGQDQIRFLQDTHGPVGHIFQVPDRGRDDVQPARHLPIAVCGGPPS